MHGTAGAQRELFISRAGEDRAVALVVEEILREAGHATFLQDHDFGHTSFMARMAEGFGKVDRGGAVVALLSPAYLKSDYAEAEPLMRRALAIDEASYGADHPDVAIRPNNLAQLLKATDRLAEAEPLMRRALAIFEASLGADHPSTRTVRENLVALLAELSSNAGDGAEAGPAATAATPPGGGNAKRGFFARLFGG